ASLAKARDAAFALPAADELLAGTVFRTKTLGNDYLSPAVIFATSASAIFVASSPL
ncbi:MAG: hypothetical protein ACI9SE_004768, partial [Neolewinella sp.]